MKLLPLNCYLNVGARMQSPRQRVLKNPLGVTSRRKEKYSEKYIHPLAVPTIIKRDSWLYSHNSYMTFSLNLHAAPCSGSHLSFQTKMLSLIFVFLVLNLSILSFRLIDPVCFWRLKDKKNLEGDKEVDCLFSIYTEHRYVFWDIWALLP